MCQGRGQTQRGHALAEAHWGPGARQLPRPLRAGRTPRSHRAVHVQERKSPAVTSAVLAVTGTVPFLSHRGDSPLFPVWLLLEV